MLADRVAYKDPRLKPVLKFAHKVVRSFFAALMPSEEALCPEHVHAEEADETRRGEGTRPPNRRGWGGGCARVLGGARCGTAAASVVPGGIELVGGEIGGVERTSPPPW